MKKVKLRYNNMKFQKQYEEKIPVYYVNGVHIPKEAIIESVDLKEGSKKYKIKYQQDVTGKYNNILADISSLFETLELANSDLNNNNTWKCKKCPLLINKSFSENDDIYCELCIHYRRNKGISDNIPPNNELLYDLDKKEYIVRVGTSAVYQVGKKQSPLFITVITDGKIIEEIVEE
jgi:hypothetical protein